MSKLNARDLTKVMECVQALLVPQDLDQFTHTAIRVIPPLVKAVVASYNEVDPPRGRFAFVVHPKELLPEAAIEKWVRYAHENPLIQHVQKNPSDFSVHKITDFVSQTKFRKTRLCSELYKGFCNAEYQIAMPFPEPGTAAVAIVFNRATDFTERDRAILTVLQPLVVLAYRKAVAFTDLRTAQDDLKWSIDGLLPGLLFVGADGSIMAVSAEARNVLGLQNSESGSVEVTAAALPAPVVSWLEEAVFAQGASSTRSAALIIRRGKRRFKVALVSRSDDRSAVLSIREVDEKARLSIEKFGLTKRESEVCARLAFGESNKEIGKRLNVNARTIEKHIEHLLLKLKATSRTAAGIIAASMMLI